MFPHVFFLLHAGVGFDRKMSIAWTRVHAIVNHSTCIKAYLSDGDRCILCRHMEGSGASDHRRGSLVVDHDRGLHRDALTQVMDQTVDINSHDWGSIAMDRGLIVTRLRPIHLAIEATIASQ